MNGGIRKASISFEEKFIPVSLLEWKAYVARGDISVPGNRIQMIEGRLVLIEYR